MKIFATTFFLSIAFCQIAIAAAKQTGEEEVLVSVSAKLTEINQRLRDHRVFVSPAVIKWAELDKFQAEVVFTVAHDPYGFIDKDIPKELNPSFLTQKLKGSWAALESSALQIGEVAISPEWVTMKTAVGEFFELREKNYYQPARKMISSGQLITLLNKVKESAATTLKETQNTKDISVKIIDPIIERMSRELSVMNRSVRELVGVKTPSPVVEPTFFKRIHANELLAVIGSSFTAGLFICLSFVWIRSKSKKVTSEQEEKVVVNSFNYYQWLKHLETNLHALKENEDNNCEEFIKLKELSGKLHLSRKHLNFADNQQDYYTSLEELNESAPEIEQYFDKINLRKNSEISRRLIKQIIQLCDAIECKKEMSFEDEVPKLKLIKLEKMSHLKAA